MGAGHLSLILNHALKGAGRIAGKKCKIRKNTSKIQYKIKFLILIPAIRPSSLTSHKKILCKHYQNANMS